jgi:ClpP class serine protease
VQVNSGGGSPVQSSIVHRRLAALKRRFPGTPLLVVVEDVCASGAYYLGCAADEILVRLRPLWWGEGEGESPPPPMETRARA